MSAQNIDICTTLKVEGNVDQATIDFIAGEVTAAIENHSANHGLTPITDDLDDEPCVLQVVKSQGNLPGENQGIIIRPGIDEEEQISSFQNATLHTAPSGLACSIAVFPKYPTDLKSMDQVTNYLKNSFIELTKKDWDIEIQIGDAS